LRLRERYTVSRIFFSREGAPGTPFIFEYLHVAWETLSIHVFSPFRDQLIEAVVGYVANGMVVRHEGNVKAAQPNSAAPGPARVKDIPVGLLPVGVVSSYDIYQVGDRGRVAQVEILGRHLSLACVAGKHQHHF
jgi:hypothetical protein